MSVNNNYQKISYGLTQALINVFPAPIVSKRAPTTADKAPIGSVWVNTVTNSVYILSSVANNMANWVSTSGGSGSFSSLTVNPGDVNVTAGNVNIVAGSLNVETGGILSESDITTSGANAHLILNDGSAFIGNFTNTASASSVSFQKDRGNSPITPQVIVTGDALGLINFEGYDGTEYVVASQITSTSSGTIATNRVASDLKFFTHPDSTTVSTLRMTIAPTGAITVAAPDSGVALTVTGEVLATTLVASGDIAGAASQTAITNVINTTQGAGTLTIKSASANAGTNTGFIKIYVGGVVNYIPYFATIAP